MQTFQYQARHQTGHRIFGVQDAEDTGALAALLSERGLVLVEARCLSIHAGLLAQRSELPRLVQLRVGERLREALLTGLPSHEAVRAMAEEPLEHPLLMLMPWLTGSALMLTVVSAILVAGVGFSAGIFLGCLTLTIIFWVAWMRLRLLLVVAPRRTLLQIADRLESGHVNAAEQQTLVPEELRALQSSKIDSELKAISIAELIPEVTEMRTQRHRLASHLMGPFVLAALLGTGIVAFLGTVVPQFAQIFTGFGVEIPLATAVLLELSEFMAAPGGLLIPVTMVGMLLGLCVVYAVVTLDSLTFVSSRMPLLGTSIRWLVQARICRSLAVLLRNRVTPSVALVTATEGAGLKQAAREGATVAAVLEQGGDDYEQGRYLRGLPISLLGQIQRRVTERHSEVDTAQVFEGFARSLENAATGHGAILIVVLELMTVVTMGGLCGLLVIGLFLPLLKLLNDLT